MIPFWKPSFFVCLPATVARDEGMVSTNSDAYASPNSPSLLTKFLSSLTCRLRHLKCIILFPPYFMTLCDI
jgi:hypothetical protein